MVSQVAPKPAVKMKVNAAAAAPYWPFFSGLFIAPRERPPARNIETPMTMAPQ